MRARVDVSPGHSAWPDHRIVDAGVIVLMRPLTLAS